MSEPRILSRRDALRRMSTGFGAAALSGLLAEDALAAAGRPVGLPHYAPKAKSVIFLFMSGGVSAIDTFDPKPRLTADHGKPMPMKVERTQFNNNGNIYGSPYAFKRYGESGLPVSEIFPHVAQHADSLAVIRSMTSKVNEHAQGNLFLHTGFPFMGHPSAGAWCSYGLGSENKNLPGYMVLRSGNAGVPHGGVGMFGNGYLPAQHQASMVQADKDEAIRNIRAADREAVQRRKLDFIAQMDRKFSAEAGAADAVDAAIQNYETAFRMQAAIPDVCDIKGESAATRKL